MTDFNMEVARRTVWQEARGDGESGMRAVCHVILNRLKDGRWGDSLASVCLARSQFSGWSTKDPNFPASVKLPSDDPILAAIESYFEDAKSEVDPTHNATHYYSVSIKEPAWASSGIFQIQINHHRFYSGVP